MLKNYNIKGKDIKDISIDFSVLEKSTGAISHEIFNILKLIKSNDLILKIQIDEDNNYASININHIIKSKASLTIDVYDKYIDLFILGYEYFIQNKVNSIDHALDLIKSILKCKINEKIVKTSNDKIHGYKLSFLKGNMKFDEIGKITFKNPFKKYHIETFSYEPWL